METSKLDMILDFLWDYDVIRHNIAVKNSVRYYDIAFLTQRNMTDELNTLKDNIKHMKWEQRTHFLVREYIIRIIVNSDQRFYLANKLFERMGTLGDPEFMSFQNKYIFNSLSTLVNMRGQLSFMILPTDGWYGHDIEIISTNENIMAYVQDWIKNDKNLHGKVSIYRADSNFIRLRVDKDISLGIVKMCYYLKP